MLLHDNTAREAVDGEQRAAERPARAELTNERINDGYEKLKWQNSFLRETEIADQQHETNTEKRTHTHAHKVPNRLRQLAQFAEVSI